MPIKHRERARGLHAPLSGMGAVSAQHQRTRAELQDEEIRGLRVEEDRVRQAERAKEDRLLVRTHAVQQV